MANSAGRGSNQGPNSFYVAPTWQQNTLTSPPFYGQKNPPVIPYGQVYQTTDWTSTSSIPSNLTFSRASYGTYYNSSGIVAVATTDTPRFEYKFDGSSWVPAGLLIEKQATNLSHQNTDFDAIGGYSTWTFSSTTHVATGLTDPLGNSEGITTRFSSSLGSDSSATQGITVAANTTYTVSCWVRKGTSGTPSNYVRLTTNNGLGWNTGISTRFALTTSWQRVSMTGNISIATTCNISVDTRDVAGVQDSLVDGTVDMYGYQVELGPIATSFIPQNRTTFSSGGTRSADLLLTTDPTLLSAQAWVMETGELNAATQATLLGVNTVVGLGATSGNALQTTDGGTQTTSNTGTWTSPTKSGLAYDLSGRVSVVLNGGTVATAANTAERPSALYFGNTNNGASDFLNGHIRNWTAYSSLNDTDLQTATVNIAYTTGVGSSAGTDTATAVGIWTQEGVGSSAGSNTSTATAAPTQAKVGSAAGTDTATATGAWIQAGAGSSAGTDTATATGSWVVAAPGSSAGANTTTAVGAWFQAGTASSAGTDTATATAAPTQAKVGSSAGANTATATGIWTQEGVGSAAGSDTATGIGRWTQAGAGSSAGSDTATATGAEIQAGVGNAAGSNATNGYALGAGAVGSATGTNTATAVGSKTQEGVGTSSGTDIATAVGSAIAVGVGSSAGANTAAAVAPVTVSGVGTAAGANTSVAHSPIIVSGVGTAIGGNFSQAISGEITHSFGGDFGDDFDIIPVHIRASKGFVAGANIATGVGRAVIVGFPGTVGDYDIEFSRDYSVYSPVVTPPGPIPQIWHPAPEYRRVQVPRARRTYGQGSGMRHKPPLGMKRRYG